MTEKKCFYCRKKFNALNKYENFCSGKCSENYEKKANELLSKDNKCEFC